MGSTFSKSHYYTTLFHKRHVHVVVNKSDIRHAKQDEVDRGAVEGMANVKGTAPLGGENKHHKESKGHLYYRGLH